MQKTITIYLGTTAARIRCDEHCKFAEAPNVSIRDFLNLITEKDWDPRFKRSIVKYYYFKYDRVNKMLYIPAYLTGFLVRYIEQCQMLSLVIKTEPCKWVTTNIQYHGKLVLRDYQETAIEFMTEPQEDKCMRSLSLKPGEGKTLIAIMAILRLQRRALIVLPASLVDQWTSVFGELTNAKLMVLRGSKTVLDIIKSNYEIDADVILTSIQTIQEYAVGNPQYKEAPLLQDFIRGLQVGVKIVDECHLNFNANVMVDIQSDIDLNLYLSATHIRSSKSSNSIFNKIFPAHIRYGELEVNTHINVTEVRYGLGQIETKAILTDRGYSQVKYEKYLLRQVTKLNRLIHHVFEPVLQKFFLEIKKPGQKLLILVGRVDFVNMLVEWLNEAHPILVSNAYYNGVSDDILTESDVIVSTVGSAGTGKDIKGLRTMILFTSFSSEPLNYQTIGRLRKMDDEPEFVFLVNSGIQAQLRHAAIKKGIYQHMVKSYSRIEL